MNNPMEREKDQIINSFEKTSSSTTTYWRTLNEISRQADVKLDDVIKIVTTSKDFVESSYRNTDGEPVFTTRKVFRKKAPFLTKMIGAFRNRID